jgi:hypothetical protein
MENILPKFNIGDKVNIDGCKNLIGVITGVMWRNINQISYEVSYISNGDSKNPIIEEWRLS